MGAQPHLLGKWHPIGRDGTRRRAPTLAQVRSPVLASIVEQMLQESSNVIAENLARTNGSLGKLH